MFNFDPLLLIINIKSAYCVHNTVMNSEQFVIIRCCAEQYGMNVIHKIIAIVNGIV